MCGFNGVAKRGDLLKETAGGGTVENGEEEFLVYLHGYCVVVTGVSSNRDVEDPGAGGPVPLLQVVQLLLDGEHLGLHHRIFFLQFRLLGLRLFEELLQASQLGVLLVLTITYSLELLTNTVKFVGDAGH